MVRAKAIQAPFYIAIVEVSQIYTSYLERIAGIEPAPPAWKAGALPLCNIREVARGTSSQVTVGLEPTIVSLLEKWFAN